MLARTDSRARALFLLIVASLLASAIGGRLVWWQVVQHDWLATMALNQLAQQQTIPAERGQIRDANGVLLATSVDLQSIFATPNTFTSAEEAQRVAGQIAPVLGLSAAELGARLASKDPWTWLKRRVDPATAGRVRALNLPGIGMIPETKRVYPIGGASPNSTIAAQVLGFVNVDGAGKAGLEYAEDALLAGQAGSVTAEEDVSGRRIADSVFQLKDSVNGADVQLTIDAGLQHLLEARLWETYQRNHAKGVTGIVMDVHTGAIKAMANFPSFNANDYATTDPSLFTNPAVSRQYEPGSVMKAFTISAALDAGAITTSDTFLDDNDLRIADVRIQNADRYQHPYGHGEITAGQVLKLSNNVGAAKIGLTLGGQKLYDAFKRFGFGAPTGIEIAGEASGVVWDPAGPRGSGNLTTAQNSFGQGLSVTAVQLAAGYAAIANGGTLVTPHVVAGWTDAQGVHHDAKTSAGERIMREETAHTVLGLLIGAVDDGVANLAQVPGYSIAGKTGTAEVAGPVKTQVRDGVDANGKAKYKTVTRYEYIHNWIDSSFIGIMPASDPQLVTLILIHRPDTWGRYIIAERPDQVFHKLAPQIFDYFAIPPDRPTAPVAEK
ncbi:MAG TPA: penicillin-binding protein 2 [Candidatus Limnocylindria bacterium]|nr:penicillin-binding protein 2 [Candidatus Limnocylindria bacterium]